MRGLKDEESTRAILEGYAIHYNFVRPHKSLNGATPAKAAKIETPSNWKSLIEQAARYEATANKATVKIVQAKNENEVMVITK